METEEYAVLAAKRIVAIALLEQSFGRTQRVDARLALTVCPRCKKGKLFVDLDTGESECGNYPETYFLEMPARSE